MATRNCADILEGVLDSYTRLAAPPDGWQVVIVDNGSTDSTPEVVRRFADRLPVTYVLEPQAGKSRAVNAGLRRVTGDLILFTDDDILPPAGWLRQYSAAAASQPDYNVFGGPAVPKWPFEPPPWAVRDNTVKNWCFANADPNDSTGPFNGLLIGGNFAVRTSAQAQIGGFNPDVGPAPGAYTMGNETDFIERLRRAGHKAWWIQAAAVEHIVRPEQITKNWMLRRATLAGRGEYRLGVTSEGPPRLIAGLPQWVIRTSVEQLWRIAASWIRRNEQDSFVARWYLNYFVGMLIEARRMRKTSR